jgi:hypothetical protein
MKVYAVICGCNYEGYSAPEAIFDNIKDAVALKEKIELRHKELRWSAEYVDIEEYTINQIRD